MEQRAVAVQCRQKSLCIEEYYGRIDFAYAFMMVHETDDKERLLQELYNSLKTGGTLLIAEPYIHVPKDNFQETVGYALKTGFESSPLKRRIKLCRSAIFKKQPSTRDLKDLSVL